MLQPNLQLTIICDTSTLTTYLKQRLCSLWCENNVVLGHENCPIHSVLSIILTRRGHFCFEEIRFMSSSLEYPKTGYIKESKAQRKGFINRNEISALVLVGFFNIFAFKVRFSQFPVLQRKTFGICHRKNVLNFRGHKLAD